MGTRTVIILLLIVAAVMPLAAQSTAALGPQIGFYKAKDADAATAMLGVALRVRLNEAIGIEGSINYRKEAYDHGYVNVKSWPVMVTGLFYPVPIAYGAIGAGWYNSAIEYNIGSNRAGYPITVTSETQQEFGWHFGGGLELPVGHSAKIVGDIRYVFLDYQFQEVPGSSSISSNFYVMTVGLLFNL